MILGIDDHGLRWPGPKFGDDRSGKVLLPNKLEEIHLDFWEWTLKSFCKLNEQTWLRINEWTRKNFWNRFYYEFPRTLHSL